VSALQTFLNYLANHEGSITPNGSTTPIGTANCYAEPPLTTASTPLKVPCIINDWEGIDPTDERQGFVPGTNKIVVYLFIAPVSNNTPEQKWPNLIPWIGPVRAALQGPPMNGDLQYRDPQFGGTCVYSKQGAVRRGIYKYRDGQKFFGLKFELEVEIDEPLDQ
jgi:hypothetical protein